MRRKWLPTHLCIHYMQAHIPYNTHTTYTTLHAGYLYTYCMPYTSSITYMNTTQPFYIIHHIHVCILQHTYILHIPNIHDVYITFKKAPAHMLPTLYPNSTHYLTHTNHNPSWYLPSILPNNIFFILTTGSKPQDQLIRGRKVWPLATQRMPSHKPCSF